MSDKNLKEDRMIYDQLKTSTTMELQMQDIINGYKKQLNQKENEFKKDKALLEQNIELLKIQIQECSKREENLKRMNETIMGSFNVFSNQGTNGKIFKEISQNNEQYIKEVIESKARLQVDYNSLESEYRVLKDQVNEMKLQVKDLEISLEKEKIQNERAHEVCILDRNQMENDIQKQNMITEEGFQQRKFALEGKIQEVVYQKDQQILEFKEKYEEKIRQLTTNFEKEKQGFEQRIQKNLNTIRKYQTHIEQNQSLNTSSFMANQSKLDISTFKSDIEVELRAELAKIINEKTKITQDLQNQTQQTHQKNEMIIQLQQKVTEQQKTIEELRQNKYDQNFILSFFSQDKSSRYLKELVLPEHLPMSVMCKHHIKQTNSHQEYAQE